MKIFIQLSLMVIIGILTPVYIGMLFLFAPAIWLWRIVATSSESEAAGDTDNEPARACNNSIRDRVLWSN